MTKTGQCLPTVKATIYNVNNLLPDTSKLCLIVEDTTQVFWEPAFKAEDTTQMFWEPAFKSEAQTSLDAYFKEGERSLIKRLVKDVLNTVDIRLPFLIPIYVDIKHKLIKPSDLFVISAFFSGSPYQVKLQSAGVADAYPLSFVNTGSSFVDFAANVCVHLHNEINRREYKIILSSDTGIMD